MHEAPQHLGNQEKGEGWYLPQSWCWGYSQQKQKVKKQQQQQLKKKKNQPAFREEKEAIPLEEQM